jgi:hypothetical protein
VSPLVAPEITRLLNVAEPEERLAVVVPPSKVALSDTVTPLVAGANTVPLSVKVTTGAGESAVPIKPLNGGSVVNAKA